MLILEYQTEYAYIYVLKKNFFSDIISISVERKKEDFVMTKKVMKIVAVLLTVAVIVSLAGSVFASDVSDGLDLAAFNGKTDTSGAKDSVTNIIGALINIIQIIGSGVAIIMLIVLAIKYISAAPGDKADIKKHAVVYVVGAIVLFAATGILQIIKNFSGNISAAK